MAQLIRKISLKSHLLRMVKRTLHGNRVILNNLFELTGCACTPYSSIYQREKD